MLASIHDLRYRFLQAQLIQLRKAAAMTQAQLAERLGVGQSYVSKIERGEAYVDVILFIDWCKVCEIKPQEAMAHLMFALASADTNQLEKHAE